MAIRIRIGEPIRYLRKINVIAKRPPDCAIVRRALHSLQKPSVSSTESRQERQNKDSDANHLAFFGLLLIPPSKFVVQNRSSLFPANAPSAVTAAIAIEYQVATNNGESSMHWEAYSVAAHPADSNPANAPARIGRDGAP